MPTYVVTFQKFGESTAGKQITVEATTASKASALAKREMREQGFKIGDGRRSSKNWNSVGVRKVNGVSSELTPARITIARNKKVAGFVKRNPKTGLVQVFVTPGVLKKNPGLRKRVKNPTDGRLTMAQIRTANKNSDKYFFSRSSMRFFNSVVYPTVYQGTGGVFFVTSESQGEGFPRYYTVREFNRNNGSIRTETRYDDKVSAIDHAKRAARR